MKEFVKLTVVCIMIVGIMLPVSVVSFAKTKNIEYDKAYEEEISYESEVDYFSLTTINDKAFYFIKIENESINDRSMVEVFTQRDELVSQFFAETGKTCTCCLNLDAKKTYEVIVYAANGWYNQTNETGYYTLTVSYNKDDFGDTNDTAESSDANKRTEGYINGSQDRDVFEFKAPRDGDFSVIFENESIDVDAVISVYTARDKELLNCSIRKGEKKTNNIVLEKGKKYYVHVGTYDNNKEHPKCGAYNFIVTQCVEGHSPKWKTVKSATCTTTGEKECRCSVCGEFIEKEIIDMIPHKYDEWIEKEQTFFTVKKSHECRECHQVENKVQLQHIWVIVVGVVAVILIIVGLINYIKSFGKRP